MNLDFILNNLGEVDKVVQLQLQNGEEPSNSYYPLVPKRNLQKKSKLIILVSLFCYYSGTKRRREARIKSLLTGISLKGTRTVRFVACVEDVI